MNHHELLHRRIESILPRVEKPVRYLGNEIHTVRKAPNNVETRVALVFPEAYEIAMSWPGQQILYNLLNTKPGVWAERAYAFWPDMEALMRENQVPAFSLETWTPLVEFDIVGFTLQYELVFTNLLAMLDLGGIPLRSAERAREHPLIIAGGPVAYNSEPIADFLDAVALGDGEDVFLEICDAHREWKRSGLGRRELLIQLSKISGVYVPRLYDIEYEAAPVEGWAMPAIKTITPTEGAPEKVRRRWVEDLNRVPFPEAPIVPLGKTVHNRLGIEVQRGCTRACRFCQAGYIYRPERQRDPEKIKQIVAASLKSTGYDEVNLLSLSIGDYGCLDPLLGDLLGPNSRGTSNLGVSLPSIRVDTLTAGIVDKIASAKRTGFTMAPEAGSPRLRDVINKPLSEEQIANAAELVFERGWSHIKFYYMIGLPTETDEDVMGIVNTARMCQQIGRKYSKKADIVVSTSTFIPKPFTPFQWEPLIPGEIIRQKQQLIANELKKTRLSYRWHDSKESFLEAVLSRGDRRVGDVVEKAYRLGARFDGWQEHFKEDLWREAFRQCNVEPGFYAHRRIPVTETLPWDHIDCGVLKEWLLRDYASGVKGKFVPDCATGRCYDCGVCDFEVIKNRTYIPKETMKTPQNMTVKGIGEHPYPIDTVDQTPLSAMMPPAPRVEVADEVWYRVRFGKEGRAVYMGHLDILEHLPRALSRAGVRLAYTQGFRPKPKLSFGPALMTGASSRSEFFDLAIMPPLPEGDVIAEVNAGLPEGLSILELTLSDRKAPTLGATIAGGVFEISERLPGTLPDRVTREESVARFLSASNVAIRTVKKTYDVRPLVKSAEATEAGFLLDIDFSSAGSAKPTDVARAILGWEEPESAHALVVTKMETRFAEGLVSHGVTESTENALS